MKFKSVLALSACISLTASLNAFADASAVTAACRNRVSAGLIQGAVIGIVSGKSRDEILCGSISSDRQAFELGSISKSFAGIALAKMTLSGKIDLEAPISTYVPELQGSYMGTATAHQLATHTSRLVRSYSDSQNTSAWLYDEPQLIAFLKSYHPDPAVFPPGKRSYSNVGFGTLGLVLSRVSGKSYTQLIQDEIIKPLEMANTGFILSSTKPAALVQGYDVLLNPSNYWNVSDLAVAAGGVFSDLHDMLIYVSANLNPDGSDLGRAMLLSQTLGLGWDSLPGTLPVRKNGLMTDGFATMIQFDPSKNMGSIVLGNEFSGPSIEALSSVAMGNPDRSRQMPLNAEYLSAIEGKYVSSNGTSINVLTVDQNYLGIEVTTPTRTYPARLLTMVGEDSKFWVDDGDENVDQFAFEIDPATMRMTATYFKNEGSDAQKNPVYESTTFVRQ